MRPDDFAMIDVELPRRRWPMTRILQSFKLTLFRPQLSLFQFEVLEETRSSKS